MYSSGESEDGGDQLETFVGPIPRGMRSGRSFVCFIKISSKEKLEVNFSRSSGPGGQNVNKCAYTNVEHDLYAYV